MPPSLLSTLPLVESRYHGPARADKRSAFRQDTSNDSTMDTINIAVIGADGVGKSSFVQRALKLARLPASNIAAVRIEVDGVPHVVTLVELDLESFDVSHGQEIHWPKQINGHMVPSFDGAMVLYDVMNKDSIRELPPTMCKSTLNAIGRPRVLNRNSRFGKLCSSHRPRRHKVR